MIATSGHERRGAERFSLRRKLMMTLSAGDTSCLAAVDDLSWSGARLRLTGTLPAHQQITLSHPAVGDLPGEPVWRNGLAIGVRFAEPAAALERTLQCISLMLYRDEYAL